MNYISAEEFSRESKEVQETFMKWWKPQAGEMIFSNGISFGKYIYLENFKQSGYRVFGVYSHEISISAKNIFVPLFQMHQLIDFIEDKTSKKIRYNLF